MSTAYPQQSFALSKKKKEKKRNILSRWWLNGWMNTVFILLNQALTCSTYSSNYSQRTTTFTWRPKPEIAYTHGRVRRTRNSRITPHNARYLTSVRANEESRRRQVHERTQPRRSARTGTHLYTQDSACSRQKFGNRCKHLQSTSNGNREKDENTCGARRVQPHRTTWTMKNERRYFFFVLFMVETNVYTYAARSAAEVGRKASWHSCFAWMNCGGSSLRRGSGLARCPNNYRAIHDDDCAEQPTMTVQSETEVLEVSGPGVETLSCPSLRGLSVHAWNASLGSFSRSFG